MKIYIASLTLYFALIISSSNVLSAQNDYLSYKLNDTIHYSLNRNFIAVQFDTSWVSDSLSVIWNRSEWDSIPIEVYAPLLSKNYFSFSIHYPTDSSLDTNDFILRTIDSVRIRQNIVAVYPFLESDDGKTSYITRNFIVKLRSDTTGNYDSADVFAYAALRDSTHTIIIEEHIYGTTFDMLAITDSTGQNSFEIAKRFFESGYFVNAEPYIIQEQAPNYNPDDTYYSQQWGIENSAQNGGTSGADADVDLAWDITTGCQDIKIALLDEGVDRQHEDLSANLLTGYDTFEPNPDYELDKQLGSSNGDISRGSFYYPYHGFEGATKYDNHGTVMAGIIGAVGDNGTGVAGIAYTSKIIPIRFASTLYTPNRLIYPSNNPTYYYHTSTASAAAKGAKQALDVNADILNISFNLIDYSPMTDIIKNAFHNGRNGLGCIVVAGTGNRGEQKVNYPANLDNVIAVGATDKNDHLTAFSNYGNEIDVCAPGESIYSTDIMGARGMNGTNYTSDAGTSCASAFVSGVMALILSAQPTLTARQARDILESTCDKVGLDVGINYSEVAGHPNGTWSNKMGYGRVNAKAAVSKAATMYIDDKLLLLYRNYFAKRLIKAGNGVRPSGTHGPVDVKEFSSTNIVFRAGEEIALLPGFSAHGTDQANPTIYPGSTFSAFIDNDCSNYYGVNGINPSGSSSAKAGLSPAAYIPPATQESSLSLSPNPVSGLLRIRFAVAATSPVHIDIVNLYGQRIATVVDGEQSQGNHNFKFDVSGLSNGMYFVQLRTPSGTVTKPIIVTH